MNPAELLHEIFEATADRSPDAVAVECAGARLTYRELDARADRLARALRARGVGPEDRVAILLPRTERLYESMLGVLKAGAAYVPLDVATPAERAAFILADSRAKVLISAGSLPDALAFPATLRLDRDSPELERRAAARVTRDETKTSPENLAYVIYTSGTTGKPKGVMIEHRSAAGLVRAESALYRVRAGDRVLQLASPAFDASVEEIWSAFAHGAALIGATGELSRPGVEFGPALERAGVTVVSCVPTFLALVEGDAPSVRLLIFGGEACPTEVAARWLKPGRVVFNTYGPTEATVVATASVLAPGVPVTIGRPLEGVRVFVLDETLAPAAAGAEGELCIAGGGVARGYLNRPELESEKFVVTDRATGAALRLYRTGDLARWTAGGELEYRGRADGQVKIRGYRVELGEIEAALAEQPDVLAAAASVHAESQRIAAYVVPRAGRTIDREALRKALAARLPPYMLPAFLDETASLPLTTAGKIDRRALPRPSRPLAGGGARGGAPRTPAEKTVLDVWSAVFGRDDLSPADDFFGDLDGHSLLAALAVSRLRRESGFERVSLSDLYARPTAEKLAVLAAPPAPPPPERPFHSASTASYWACAAGQALGIVFLSFLYAWQWLGPYLAYGYMIVADYPLRDALLVAVAVELATTPGLILLSIALKWALLGRIKPGSHPLWGWYYWRFWLVRAVSHAAPLRYFAGTPILNVCYRLMGARIGKDVYFGANGSRRSNGLATFDLMSVGDGSSVGMDTSLDGSFVDGGMLHLAPITIGRGCFIGNRCSIGANAVMEDGAGLDDLSMLEDGARVPAGELWKGSPAARAGRLEAEAARSPWSVPSALLQIAGVMLFPSVTLIALFPGWMLMTHLGHLDEGYSFLMIAPLIALTFVVFFCLEIWALKWLLIGRLREGRYPIGGSFYVRKWLFDQVMDITLEVTESLYTTLYLRPWLKILGARIGPRSEIDAIRFQPDLFSAEEECFMGGDVLIGAPRARSGWVEYRAVRAGRRVFGGAGSVLPGGSVLGSNVLVGTLSIPPGGAPVPDDSAWFGSPPIALRARPGQNRFSESETYRPPARLVALRLFIEFFRVILPLTLFLVLASLMINATDILQDRIELGEWLLTLPFLYIAAGLFAVGATLVLKWLLVGRCRAGAHPLWCAYVWRAELVAGVYANLCVNFFLDMLRGTPFIAWPLRALGMTVGRRCYIDTTWFSDFDLVEIGDEAALNDNATPLTQLFEGRVMMMGRVRIGARCRLGAEASLQYDTEMQAGSSLGEMSLLMTGETLPARTRWHGIPARPEDAAPHLTALPAAVTLPDA
ncbi:MAG: Pls/PosA family non-ribosomal peptide synthetase [Elusimicrobiota bacterium]